MIKIGDNLYYAHLDISRSGRKTIKQIPPIEVEVIKVDGEYVYVRDQAGKTYWTTNSWIFQTWVEAKYYWNKTINDKIQELRSDFDRRIKSLSKKLI